MDGIRARLRKNNCKEIKHSELYKKLMVINQPLTMMDRLLLAAILKRIATTPKIRVNVVVWAGDQYIEMNNKEDESKFK